MKTLLILCGILAAVNLPAADGGLVARPATQAEVNAGTVRSKFVSPATLAGYSTGSAGTGLVGDGVTDNTVALSNAFRSGYVYLPAGTFVISNVVHASNPVKFLGIGTLKYVGDHTATAVKLNGFSNYVSGITLDFGKAMGNTPSNGVALQVNPVGGSTVSGVAFRNMPGIGVLVFGDSNITQRSNLWAVINCTFDRVASPVHCAQTNRSQYGAVANNRMNDYSGTGVFVGGPNVVVSGNVGSGYLGGTNNYTQGTGIWVEPSATGTDPGLSHLEILGNHLEHNTYDLRLLNCTGGGLIVSGNGFMGGAYSVISNTANTRVINNTFNPYGSPGLYMTNNTSFTFANNQVSGNVVGTNNSYYGWGNYNGSGNFFATDKVQAGAFWIEGAGTLAKYGTDQLAVTKWSGGYGTLVADKFWALTTFWLNNAGIFSYQSEADTISLDAWSGGVGTGKMKGATFIANRGFTSTPLVCTTATTNWSGQGLIVAHTNTVVVMSVTGQEGKRFRASRSPLNNVTAGEAKLYCTNGSFYVPGSHAFTTNLTLSYQENLGFFCYGTNFVLEY